MSELIGTWCDRGTLAVSGNTTAETTVDTTPRKIGAFTTSVVASGVTVSTANDNIVIADAGAVGCRWIGSLVTNDFVEIFASVPTGTLSIDYGVIDVALRGN